MSESMVSEGYELQGDKYYRLYPQAMGSAHLQATLDCNNYGARLAMFKNADDYAVVKGYKCTYSVCRKVNFAFVKKKSMSLVIYLAIW